MTSERRWWLEAAVGPRGRPVRGWVDVVERPDGSWWRYPPEFTAAYARPLRGWTWHLEAEPSDTEPRRDGRRQLLTRGELEVTIGADHAVAIRGMRHEAMLPADIVRAIRAMCLPPDPGRRSELDDRLAAMRVAIDTLDDRQLEASRYAVAKLLHRVADHVREDAGAWWDGAHPHKERPPEGAWRAFRDEARSRRPSA